MNMLIEVRDTLVREPASTTLVRGSPCSSPQTQPQDISNDNVSITEGMEVNRLKLQRCNHQQPTKLICDLLGVVFSCYGYSLPNWPQRQCEGRHQATPG
ncbi:hypothetical protein SKAU_G00235420 [Synaphobranchus kaupii]|uniref:Uncharacterized protein n=1 Tax=Synaphobranchus kaupii TaxID=118154 RepID=A0A9Q1F6I3_SYNKA|nr:hypothetical protein SKAU_G00235420 [Synaphobranchus kaupii]